MRGARAKHWVQRIDFNPPPEAQKQAYGVSLKWWPANKLYLIPRIYDAPCWDKKGKFAYLCNRLVVGWLKATIVFYWPSHIWRENKPKAESEAKDG